MCELVARNSMVIRVSITLRNTWILFNNYIVKGVGMCGVWRQIYLEFKVKTNFEVQNYLEFTLIPKSRRVANRVIIFSHSICYVLRRKTLFQRTSYDNSGLFFGDPLLKVLRLSLCVLYFLQYEHFLVVQYRIDFEYLYKRNASFLNLKIKKIHLISF